MVRRRRVEILKSENIRERKIEKCLEEEKKSFNKSDECGTNRLGGKKKGKKPK